MSEKRLRLLHLLVQPVLVWDDGSELTAGPDSQARALSLSDAQQVIARMPTEIEQLGAQLAAEVTPA